MAPRFSAWVFYCIDERKQTGLRSGQSKYNWCKVLLSIFKLSLICCQRSRTDALRVELSFLPVPSASLFWTDPNEPHPVLTHRAAGEVARLPSAEPAQQQPMQHVLGCLDQLCSVPRCVLALVPPCYALRARQRRQHGEYQRELYVTYLSPNYEGQLDLLGSWRPLQAVRRQRQRTKGSSSARKKG